MVSKKSRKEEVQKMTIQEIGKPGFRYRTDFERPNGDLVQSFKNLMDQTGCLTGNVGDCLGRNAAMNSRLKSLKEGIRAILNFGF